MNNANLMIVFICIRVVPAFKIKISCRFDNCCMQFGFFLGFTVFISRQLLLNLVAISTSLELTTSYHTKNTKIEQISL